MQASSNTITKNTIFNLQPYRIRPTYSSNVPRWYNSIMLIQQNISRINLEYINFDLYSFFYGRINRTQSYVITYFLNNVNLIYIIWLTHVGINSSATKQSQSRRLQRQTTNAKIISNANICDNKNSNQEKIHSNLRKKYDAELNSSNHSKREGINHETCNSNIRFLGKIIEHISLTRKHSSILISHPVIGKILYDSFFTPI